MRTGDGSVNTRTRTLPVDTGGIGAAGGSGGGHAPSISNPTRRGGRTRVNGTLDRPPKRSDTLHAMAPKRRGGSRGFRPPELKGTLGTLLRTAIQQAGGVKDALTRGAQHGRAKIDELRGDRRRHEALAELGEIVLDLIRRGEIDVAELPEARDLIRSLDELDAEGEDAADIETTQPFDRRRFDDRGSPPAPSKRGEDGTVGSGARWSPAKTATTPQRSWRPTADEAGPEPKTAPQRKGGISFDDDDLAEYMHPDDVPPKDPSDSEP